MPAPWPLALGGRRVSGGARPSAAALLLASACLAPLAAAQTESQVTLTRKDTTIVVTLKAQYADGARFIGNNPNCADGARQTLLYGPDPGYVDTRVGKDTELRSNVAIVRAQDGPGAAGGNGGPGAASVGAAGGPGSAASAGASPSDQQTLELFDGTITISRPGCIDTRDRVTTPSVTLIQGRTTVKGTRFFLDQGKDTGSMDGPIELDRAPKGDSPALNATADGMTFDTQTRHSTLKGNVRVTSGDRVTTADTLELDEKAGIAVLTGSPAKSVKGQDVLQGNTLRYYLNSNDVVVLGAVQGDIEITTP